MIDPRDHTHPYQAPGQHSHPLDHESVMTPRTQHWSSARFLWKSIHPLTFTLPSGFVFCRSVEVTNFLIHSVIVTLCLFCLGSCASTGTTGGDRSTGISSLGMPIHLTGDGSDAPDSPQTKTIEGVTTDARILPDAEARKLYGVNLAGKGIQAVWMRVSNKTSGDQWMLAAHLDPDYYTADEAAYVFRHKWGGLGYVEMQQRFRDLTMRARIGAGETHEGHVLVPRKEGGRYVEITTNGHGKVRRFGFPLRTPDGHFDFERMNVAENQKQSRPDNLSRSQLRTRLEKLPTTVTNEKGTAKGDPINLVIVGDSSLMMSSMSECGWAFTHRIDGTTIRRMITAALVGNPYMTAPVSSVFVFGRKQDVAFQRARTNLSQRNHLRLWLAPFTVEGTPVWVGQVSRDIGIIPGENDHHRAATHLAVLIANGDHEFKNGETDFGRHAQLGGAQDARTPAARASCRTATASFHFPQPNPSCGSGWDVSSRFFGAQVREFNADFPEGVIAFAEVIAVGHHPMEAFHLFHQQIGIAVDAHVDL